MSVYILADRPPVGNCALWWRPSGQGYTCDLTQAGLYSPEDAARICAGSENVAVPMEQAEALARKHVDWADVRRTVRAGA